MTCYGAAILYYNIDLKEFKKQNRNKRKDTKKKRKNLKKKWKKYCGVHVSDEGKMLVGKLCGVHVSDEGKMLVGKLWNIVEYMYLMRERCL